MQIKTKGKPEAEDEGQDKKLQLQKESLVVGGSDSRKP